MSRLKPSGSEVHLCRYLYLHCAFYILYNSPFVPILVVLVTARHQTVRLVKWVLVLEYDCRVLSTVLYSCTSSILVKQLLPVVYCSTSNYIWITSLYSLVVHCTRYCTVTRCASAYQVQYSTVLEYRTIDIYR